MPRKKSNLDNACSRKARLQRALRARESEEETAARNAAQRISTAEIRRQESQEQRDERLRQNVLRTRTARQQNIARFRELERKRQQTSRALTRASFFRLAFEYEPDINYSAHSKITIGAMNKICQYCHALKFRNETTGMCCASGKNVLPPLPTPPEPLKSLLAGKSDDSKLFLLNGNNWHKTSGAMNSKADYSKIKEVYEECYGDTIKTKMLFFSRHRVRISETDINAALTLCDDYTNKLDAAIIEEEIQISDIFQIKEEVDHAGNEQDPL
ncbi:unnamed protein product [Diatraea saccharalis]|uniref:Uncharacterized protein n=1 Tax=Diatraea saccharalis TaxID=40085 RepID=A0A9N9R952_9NEOP|nr:unnamed protein product [Diatraea saccharalis]